jgi:hypothetical protein
MACGWQITPPVSLRRLNIAVHVESHTLRARRCHKFTKCRQHQRCMDTRNVVSWLSQGSVTTHVCTRHWGFVQTRRTNGGIVGPRLSWQAHLHAKAGVWGQAHLDLGLGYFSTPLNQHSRVNTCIPADSESTSWWALRLSEL